MIFDFICLIFLNSEVRSLFQKKGHIFLTHKPWLGITSESCKSQSLILSEKGRGSRTLGRGLGSSAVSGCLASVSRSSGLGSCAAQGAWVCFHCAHIVSLRISMAAESFSLYPAALQDMCTYVYSPLQAPPVTLRQPVGVGCTGLRSSQDVVSQIPFSQQDCMCRSIPGLQLPPVPADGRWRLGGGL